MKKRLYFILAEQHLFHLPYLVGVLKSLNSKKYQVVGVTVAKDTHKEGIKNYLLKQYQLWGPVGFATIGLANFLKSYRAIDLIAKKYHLRYFETYNVNSKEHFIYLKKLSLDVIISSCGQIFRKELLNIPRIACINRHTALLPKYGGVLPVFWAMLFNEKEFGVSVHYMVMKIDQGDILAQVTIPMRKENSLFKNYVLGFRESVAVTIGALENLGKGKIYKKFSLDERCYFPYPSLKEIKEFKQRYKTFSWTDIFSLLFEL